MQEPTIQGHRTITVLLLAAMVGFALNSYPMMYPGYDFGLHLNTISDLSTHGNNFWHAVWAQTFAHFGIPDVDSQRGLIIHRTQTFITLALLLTSAYWFLGTALKRLDHHVRFFVKQGGTILFVSHDTPSVRGLCTQALWIDKGVKKAFGDPKNVCDQYLESFFESRQGISADKKFNESSVIQSGLPKRDHRQDLLNSTRFRNDIELFSFDPHAPSIGKLGARIVSVEMTNLQGEPYAWVVGGEEIQLRVMAVVDVDLNCPIIGFYVKDRLGQNLFGENSFLTYCDRPITVDSGQRLEAIFTFMMPRMPTGDYSIGVAIADETQSDHVHQHWIHDALFFRSEASSVSSGLLGIPIHDITLKIATPEG